MAPRALRLTAVIAAIVFAGCGSTSKSSSTAAVTTATTSTHTTSTSPSTSTERRAAASSKLAARLLASNGFTAYVRRGGPLAAGPASWAAATNVPEAERANEQALLARLGFRGGATEVFTRKPVDGIAQSTVGYAALSGVAQFASASDAAGYFPARLMREKAAAKPGEFIAVPVPGIPHGSAYALRNAERTTFTIAFTSGPYVELVSSTWPSVVKDSGLLAIRLGNTALKLYNQVGKLSGG